MKKKDMVGFGTIAVFACLLLCTPALADYSFDGFPVETRVNGTVNGGVFIGYEPWDDKTTLTGSFDVPNGTVKWARLYTGIWDGTEDNEGWVGVTFNGVDDSNGLGPIHLQGANDVNPNVWCSGYGKNWIYYNVTDLVSAGAENTATTTKINATFGDFDGRVYGTVLVVVYEGGDNPKNIQYWINDGSDWLNSKTPNDNGTTDFAGTVGKGTVTEAELTMVHLTAYNPVCANCLAFNGQELNTSMVDSNDFELNTWDVTGYVAQSGNEVGYSRGEDGYVSVCNAILTLEVVNGYMGKRYTGGDDINTWDTFELNGNLIYSVGDSYYLSSYSYPDWTEYNVGWTASDLQIPGTATVTEARLYVPYTWDKAGVMPDSVGMSFNGKSQTLDAYYSDRKGWSDYNYPYGMLVYNVTAGFDTSGNAAALTNSYPGGDNVSMRGMLLVVVYADDSEPKRKIIMNEEFDMLYGGAKEGTTPAEATAYAPFGSIDTAEVAKATLISVAPGAGPNEGDLGFNTHMWYDVWNFVGKSKAEMKPAQIGIAVTDVTPYIQAADNRAYFQSSADYMEASNAFLILDLKP